MHKEEVKAGRWNNSKLKRRWRRECEKGRGKQHNQKQEEKEKEDELKEKTHLSL